MRYRATLAYDGTGYAGFQRQANAPTIQGEVEAALEKITGEFTAITGAGRTDAGVHASGQVIAFDLEWRHSTDDLRRALNATLPAAMAVREVDGVKADFHPRFDARLRRYRYCVLPAPVRDPLRRLITWHVQGTLDQGAMQEAANCLPGQHDFASFGTPPAGDSTVRMVHGAEWRRNDDELEFWIAANAFLYKMVRRIVGTLVQVGQKRMTPDEFRGILAACNPELAAAPAPPEGLTLIAVEYD